MQTKNYINYMTQSSNKAITQVPVDLTSDASAMNRLTGSVNRNKDDEFIQKCREAFKLTKKDHVQIHVVPKGCSRLNYKQAHNINQDAATLNKH